MKYDVVVDGTPLPVRSLEAVIDFLNLGTEGTERVRNAVKEHGEYELDDPAVFSERA